MQSKLDKWMETAGNVASEAVRATGDLVNKAGTKANELAVAAKISKMQRQLGALVYALRKNGDDNEPMIQWYIREIDRLKAQMPPGEAVPTTETEVNSAHFYGTDAGEAREDAMFRSCDSDELP